MTSPVPPRERRRRLPELDSVLPDQYFATVHRQLLCKTGEYQLMAAVLEDAIHCFQKYAFATGRRAQHLFRETEEWLFGEGAGWFSFEHICEVLDLDPSYLRRGLQAWLSRMTAQIEARQGARPTV